MAKKLKLDGIGQADVFDMVEGKWRKAYPVDIREGIAVGTFSATGPTVGLIDSKGKKMVACPEQVDHLCSKGGFKIDPDAVKEVVKVAVPKADTGPYNFTRHNLEDLRRFAAAAKIQSEGKTKAQLVELLDEAGFNPSAAEEAPEEDED